MKLPLILSTLCICSASFATNYVKGDTMYVAALNGLKLRESAGESAKMLMKLNCGDTLLILDVFEYKLQPDTIFDFPGSWVKVRSTSHKLDGFVFDAFISHYPVLAEKELMEDFAGRSLNEESMSWVLPNYVSRVFRRTGCETRYFNGSDGEGYHSLVVAELEGGNQFVENSYWEGGDSELQLPDPRQSEVYYLVLNLLKYFPDNTYIVNDVELRQYGGGRYPCAVTYTGDQDCLVRLYDKSGSVYNKETNESTWLKTKAISFVGFDYW